MPRRWRSRSGSGGAQLLAALAGQVNGGALRAIAVAGPRRIEASPGTPTFEEAGLPGIDGSSWQGLFVPAGTPAAIVKRLHVEAALALQSADVRKAIIEGGSEVGGMEPAQFAAFVRADRERWRKAVKDGGIEAQ